MATVRIGGREVAYRESAGGGRPVVLLHGNSASGRVWRPLLSGPFGERFRCLAPDLPGHGDSPPLRDPAGYSLPRYADLLTGFVAALDADGAVIVGWDLGGHIALEAAPALPTAAGLVILGAPPVGPAGLLGSAFLPNPAVNLGFTQELDEQQAHEYARSFLAPDSTVPPEPFAVDILGTDGRARAAIAADLAEGRFTDEVEIVAGLRVPLAILHGRQDQLVSLDYLRGLTAPTLWRGAVQVVERSGHAPHIEDPDAVAALLSAFADDLT